MSFKQSPEFLAATAVGISCATAFSSICYGISYLSIPALLLCAPNAFDKKLPSTASGHLARQWQYIFDLGKVVGPPVAALSAGSFIYAMAFIPRDFTTQRRLYFAAALLVVSIVPFTIIVLNPTNIKLQNAAAAAVESDQEEIHETQSGKVASDNDQSMPALVRKWAKLNSIRGFPPLLGIGCVIAVLLW